MGVSQPSHPLQPSAVRFEVRGRVQGVGFRYTTRGVARELGLVGWVRNLPSGGVEVFAQGAPQALEHLHAFLERGPRGAHVETLTPGSAEFDHRLRSFDVVF
jgi:acylphosphatase